MIHWISALHKKINKTGEAKPGETMLENKVKGVSVALNWAYGMRCTDVINSFYFTEVYNLLDPSDDSQASETIVYFVASIVIVYFHKANIQRHYLHHSTEVTAIAISKGNMVASAERGPCPEIHLWRIDERKPLRKIRNLHQNDIYLLHFMKDSRYLISCGKRMETTIAVSDLLEASLHNITTVDCFVRNISSISEFSDSIGSLRQSTFDGDDYFIMYSREDVFINDCRNFDYKMTKFGLVSPDMKHAEISSVLCLIVGMKDYQSRSSKGTQSSYEDPEGAFQSFRLITGHSNGPVILWTYDGSSLKHDRLVQEYNYSIIEILLLKDSIALASDDAIIYIWNIELTNCLYELNLSHLNFKLYSLKIKNIRRARDRLLLNTFNGDMIFLDTSMRSVFEKDTFLYKISGKRLKNIVSFSGKLKTLEIIEQRAVIEMFLTEI
jgi:hypothetical protein